MAHSLNYAEVWEPQLIEINIQNLLSSPFLAKDDDVNWLDGQTFHFTTMKTSGFRNHILGGKFKEGKITQADHAFTITHDRDISFLVDKKQVHDTNSTADMNKVANNFEQTNAVPETDALFFETIAKKAIAAGGKFAVQIEPEGINKTNVVEKLIQAVSPVKRYRGTLIGYVSTNVMDRLEEAIGDKAKIEWTTISNIEHSIETRVATFNGIYLMEVIDDNRFYTAFDYKDDIDGGFEPSVSGGAIEILLASTATAKIVKKIQSIYFFEPGSHTEGDGWLYQHREAWDTFVFPNGKDGLIDSCVVYYNAAA